MILSHYEFWEAIVKVWIDGDDDNEIESKKKMKLMESQMSSCNSSSAKVERLTCLSNTSEVDKTHQRGRQINDASPQLVMSTYG